MHESIGFLELGSIAAGIEAADSMLKAAEVSLLSAKPSCPGKYVIMVTGGVEAVETAMNAGCLTGDTHVVDSTIIPRVHPDVIRAIAGMTEPKRPAALGIMEFFSVTCAIYGADAAVKASNIELIEIRPGTGIGGKSFVILTGDVSAVKISVQAGIRLAAAEGMLLNHAVIPHPHRELINEVL